MKPDPVLELLHQLDIVISSVGDREISAHCPFHEDRHPSFSINIANQLWICYQCGRRGNLAQLVEEISGERGDVQQMLRAVKRRRIRRRTVKEKPEPAPDSLLIFAEYESLACPPSWALEQRGLDDDVVGRYGIKWDKGWVIPIWSPDDKPVLWGWQFKRMQFVSNYPKAVKKSQTLFGLRELTQANVVLVESPLDVVRLASVGVGALASFGAWVSNVQISLLMDTAKRVILALDQDEEGRTQTNRIYKKIAREMPTRIASLPRRRKDPGECTSKELREAFG